MSKQKHLLQSGFSLLELVVVMMIIGVLAAVLLVNFQAARTRSRDAARKADLRQIKSALQIYYNDYQQFPASSLAGEIDGCGASGTSTCAWGGSFTAGGTQYMNSIPVDPINSGTYVFTYEQTSVDSYTLTAILENASDEDLAKTQARCGSGTGNEYVVCQD